MKVHSPSTDEDIITKKTDLSTKEKYWDTKNDKHSIKHIKPYILTVRFLFTLFIF